MTTNEPQLKRAANSALFSVLNLTILPVIGFIALLFLYSKTEPNTIDRYYAALGIKTNLLALVALPVVSCLMVVFVGLESPWFWAFIAPYFVFVHAMFILFALWTLSRSWSGEKLKRQFLTK